jgi:hypothetical protein
MRMSARYTYSLRGLQADSVCAFHLPCEDAAVSGIDPESFTDELGQVGGGFLVIHIS